MAHIVIGDIAPRISYTVGPTPQTLFVVPFPFFESGDLDVYIDGALQILGADYTASGAGLDEGGSITFVSPLTDCRVSIVRNAPIARTTDFPTSGPFQISALNTDLDRVTAWAQELNTRIQRSLRPPDGDPDGDFVLPALEARRNRFAGYDGDGMPAVMVDASGYPASVYGASLVSSADAAAARGLLGVTAAGSDLVLAADLAAQRNLLRVMPRYLTGEALPSSNIGPIWHDDYASVMTWRVFNANGANYTGYASVDIGRITIPGAGVAEAGTLKASGAIFNPSTYPALYHWAVHRGIVVASGSWAQGREQYGYVDATQVRLPDLRGEFPRFWDDGRGVDSGRAFGSWADHMLQTHLHTAFSLAVGLVIGTGSGYAATVANTSAPTTGNVGSETRPRSTALLATIKY
jgi:hypothetical protein